MTPQLAQWLSARENAMTVMLAMVICAARPVAFMTICPVFTRFGIQRGLVRGAITVALISPVLPHVLARFAGGEIPPAGPDLMRLLAFEILVGLSVGLIVGLPFWAVTGAGDIIDFQRGASMATVVDPGSGGETTVSGTLFLLSAIGMLLSLGLFVPAIFGPMLASYRIVPLLDPATLDAARGALVLRWLDDLMRGAVLLALPLVIPLLLVEFFLALSLKYVQQMNAMVLAMAVKQIVYVLVALVYVTIAARHAITGLGGESEALLPGLFGPRP